MANKSLNVIPGPVASNMSAVITGLLTKDGTSRLVNLANRFVLAEPESLCENIVGRLFSKRIKCTGYAIHSVLHVMMLGLRVVLPYVYDALGAFRCLRKFTNIR